MGANNFCVVGSWDSTKECSTTDIHMARKWPKEILCKYCKATDARVLLPFM